MRCQDDVNNAEDDAQAEDIEFETQGSFTRDELWRLTNEAKRPRADGA
jgi:hypothetical protein